MSSGTSRADLRMPHQDMGGQKPEVKHMKQGEHGLEMNSADGWLLLLRCHCSLKLGIFIGRGRGGKAEGN